MSGKVPGWAQFFLDSQGEQTDTASEKRKVRSLMRKRGLSEGAAIAILKSRGAISKKYGNDESRPVDGGTVSVLAGDAKKKKKKKKKKWSY